MLLLKLLLVPAVLALISLAGRRWGPVLAIVLAVFSHRTSGPAFATVLLKAIIWGLYAFTSFCLTLAVLLPQQGVTVSFVAATAVAIAVQWALKSRLHRR